MEIHRSSTKLRIKNDVTRQSVGHTLKPTGWTVAEAINGRLGLEQLTNSDKPDAIVLDLLMPEMDGFAFCARLCERAYSEYQEIPVIVITGADLSDSDKEQLLGGVTHIIEKAGYSQTELYSDVRRLIHRSMDIF